MASAIPLPGPVSPDGTLATFRWLGDFEITPHYLDGGTEFGVEVAGVVLGPGPNTDELVRPRGALEERLRALVRAVTEYIYGLIGLAIDIAAARNQSGQTERNMDALFGVRFLASEYGTGVRHSGRIDSLGPDENSSPGESLGHDVTKTVLMFYFAFRRLKNVACVEVHTQTKLLVVYLKVDPDTVNLEDGRSRRTHHR